MESVLDNKWFYWLITGLVAALWAALLYFLKRQRDADDARFQSIEKRQEADRERVNNLIAELPINYTLRDEFLRVTTAQTAKLDKITDMLASLQVNVAEIWGKGGERKHD